MQSKRSNYLVEMMAKYTNQELVDDIEKYGENLTSFEIDLVDSVGNQLANGFGVSETQEALLKQIHEERVE